MKIRMLTSIAGFGIDYRMGEETEVGDGLPMDEATAKRLIKSGQAELVRTESRSTATKPKRATETATK